MKQEVRNPHEIIASVLKVPVQLITINSGYGIDSGWDSLRHIIIIGELEKEYNITIPDNDIEKYTRMEAIVELHNRCKSSDGLKVNYTAQ